MFLKSKIAQNMVIKAVGDLITTVDSYSTDIATQLSTEIQRIQNDITSSLGYAQNAIDSVTDLTTEYIFKGNVAGSNDDTDLLVWRKIVQLNPPSGNVKLKQISFNIRTMQESATATEDDWIGWIKFKNPYTYVPTNATDFDEFAEPYYKIHPMSRESGYDVSTGDLLAYAQAWGIPECEMQIGGGGTQPENNFHGPYRFIVNIPIDYQLSSRGLQVWTWISEAVSIGVSFMYVSDGEVLTNEA